MIIPYLFTAYLCVGFILSLVLDGVNRLSDDELAVVSFLWPAILVLLAVGVVRRLVKCR